MNRFVRKHLKEIFVTVASVLSVILISCALILIDNFSDGLYKQAVDAVDHHSEEYQTLFDKQIDYYTAKAQEIADTIPGQRLELSSYILDLKEDPANNIVAFMRIYMNGSGYDAELGTPVSISLEPEELQGYIRSNRFGVTGLFNDPINYSRVFGVHIPVNRGEIQSICVFFQNEALFATLEDSYKRFESETPADYLYVCAYPDEVVSILDAGDSLLGNKEITVHDKFMTYLRSLTDKSTVDLIEQGISNGGVTHEVLINGTRYVLTVKPSKLAGEELYVIGIYNSYNVYAEGHELAAVLGAIIVVVVVIIIALAVYILLVRFKLAKQVDTYDLEDPIYGCPNFRYYSDKAVEILERNRATKYAVIYTEIAHFSYIDETFGSSVSDEALKFLIKVYEKALKEEEVFGRINDDHFALLFHYGSDEELMNRLNTITSLAYHCPALKKYNFYLRLSIGVCPVNRDETNWSMQKFLDRAIIARRTNLTDSSKNVHVYSEKVHESFMLEAEIESKMEAALRNNEFKMFYQPKYNIERNRPDGCEALVRWYDAENNRFRPPSEFLPLFETNGFIAELDKYVMNEVCKFIAESLSRGYRMIPVSVNVSRVTASKEGFLEYYVAAKKKFGIRDRFLTIEFTESFAYENYDVISNIVNKFHATGFECSIDDFGSGFSSYNILKELPMDEIKLDRFFIKPGISRERDDNLLKSIISLAKTLNMKVTQEGVETVEDLKRLKEFGCDVVQGYIYAKPMAATDFLEFIRSGGSLHIV